jgi:dienelactone hydrolase
MRRPLLAFVIASFIPGTVLAQLAKPPFYPDRMNLLVVVDEQGKTRPVATAAYWQRRCEHIRGNMELVMGPVPERWRGLPLDLRVIEEARLSRCTRKRVTYRADPGDWVTAYLFVPNDLKGKTPAMLCLHQTIEIGKDEPAGLGGSPDLSYALELAERGYVTLAPDYWTFGDYRFKKYDPYDSGYVSGTMKGIWNHMRSVDLLGSLPEVDGDRIGCIGHSLGGHNTLWLGAFDRRIKVLVSSCGFSTMASYAASKYGGGDLHNYAQRRYLPRVAGLYQNDPKRVPFEWTEVLASLAPRPVFVNAPVGDVNYEVAGVRDCLTAARPVYEWMKAGDQLVAVHPNAEHSFPPEVRRAAYAFVDKALRGK